MLLLIFFYVLMSDPTATQLPHRPGALLCPRHQDFKVLHPGLLFRAFPQAPNVTSSVTRYFLLILFWHPITLPDYMKVF